MNTWLLQSSPHRWRFEDAIRDGRPPTTWTVSHDVRRIVKGDRLVFLVSGGRGVVALGDVETPAVRISGEMLDDPYWTEPRVADARAHSIGIRVTEVLDRPISAAELKADPRFAGAQIVRMAGGANPFELWPPEWQAIAERLPDVGQRRFDWTLLPGDRIRRSELHDRYGGSRQGGMCPSSQSPNIFLFTDSETGAQHGYHDDWAEDGSFRYVGEGPTGDQTMDRGNRALRDHAVDGRAVRLLEGSRGEVTYVGEFLLADGEPYEQVLGPQLGNTDLRRVFRFHLIPTRADGPPDVDSSRTGVEYRRANEDVDIAASVPRNQPDPDAYGRGLRDHRRLQNRLADLARTAGFSPQSPGSLDPDFDLAWSPNDGRITVVEIKSMHPLNEVRQLRLGLGQVLDYADALMRRGLQVTPTLYLQQAPADPRWADIATRVGVALRWPDHENEVVI